jgi:energy-coupling factor transporter transmembrane protein EcfT
MARQLTFQYIPGQSCLHRFDARCKLLALVVCSMGSLHMNWVGLGLFSVQFIALTLTLGRWSRIVFRTLGRWSIFILMLFMVQAFSLESLPRPIPLLPVTGVSLEIAALSCWRLAVVIAYATLFTLVTSPRELEGAVAQILRALPFLPARRIGTMVSLTLRFLPLLLAQADEVRFAFRSRMGDRRRNPLDRVRFHAIPILRKSLVRAEELTFALASRGYRDDLPIAAEPIPLKHIAVVAAWSGITAIGVWVL